MIDKSFSDYVDKQELAELYATLLRINKEKYAENYAYVKGKLSEKTSECLDSIPNYNKYSLEKLEEEYSSIKNTDYLLRKKLIENTIQIKKEAEREAIFIKELQKIEEESNFSFYEIFIPGKDYLFLPLILDVNILVFLLMIISGVDFLSPAPIDLFHWGGIYQAAIFDGEIWRLFTAMFIHDGVIHLLFNMSTFCIIAFSLEIFLNKPLIFGIYFACGIAASIISTIFIPDNVVSVGASGAIFGLYGFTFVFFIINRQKDLRDFGEMLGGNLLVFIAYNIYYGFQQSNIDNPAHLGGLLTGAFIGLILSRLPNMDKLRNKEF